MIEIAVIIGLIVLVTLGAAVLSTTLPEASGGGVLMFCLSLSLGGVYLFIRYLLPEGVAIATVIGGLMWISGLVVILIVDKIERKVQWPKER